MGDIYSKNGEYERSIEQYVGVCEKSPDILYMVYEKLRDTYSKINKSESFFKYMTNFVNHSSFSYLNEIKNIGIKIGADHLNKYPKKLGILIPDDSEMDFTIKLGALPIYVIAPINTAPADMANKV